MMSRDLDWCSLLVNRGKGQGAKSKHKTGQAGRYISTRVSTTTSIVVKTKFENGAIFANVK